MSTATPKGAQAHARSQADTVVETMATLPASRFGNPPHGVLPDQLTWAETIAGGGYTSVLLQRADTLRLTDTQGEACAHLLVYNARQPVERLNVADTIKVQWQAYPTTGSVLLSDLGRALATITADSSGRHDTLCGASTRLGNTARYGDGSPHGPTPAGRELFKLAAAKHGLDARDIPPSLSLFQGVRADAAGGLTFIGSAGPGHAVELVAEMAVLVLIANAAHPLDSRAGYTCTSLSVLAWRGEAADPGARSPDARSPDARSPEMARAVENTAAYLAMSGAPA